MANKIKSFLEVLFRMSSLVSSFLAWDIVYHWIAENNYGLYVVPMSYYLNKIGAGFVLAVIGYYVVNNFLKWSKYSLKKTAVFAAIIVVPLQIMYITKGHFTGAQNLMVIFIHFAIIFSMIWGYFKLYKQDYLV